jgi:hypothetical protein
MKIREVRDMWHERDCAVGLAESWWVRFGKTWFRLPKRIGEDENAQAEQKSADAMLTLLAGTVLRCSCCGALYSPMMVVSGQFCGGRHLVATKDDGLLRLAEACEQAASMEPGERLVTYLGIDGKYRPFSAVEPLAVADFDADSKSRLAELGLRWLALHNLGGSFVLTVGHRDFVARREIPAEIVPRVLSQYFSMEK